jgi:hypothetical protein
MFPRKGDSGIPSRYRPTPFRQKLHHRPICRQLAAVRIRRLVGLAVASEIERNDAITLSEVGNAAERYRTFHLAH